MWKKRKENKYSPIPTDIFYSNSTTFSSTQSNSSIIPFRNEHKKLKTSLSDTERLKPLSTADNINIYSLNSPLLQDNSTASYSTGGFKIEEISEKQNKKVLYSKKFNSKFSSSGGVIKKDVVGPKSPDSGDSIPRKHAEISLLQHMSTDFNPANSISKDSPLVNGFMEIYKDLERKQYSPAQIRALKLRNKLNIQNDKYTPCIKSTDSKGRPCNGKPCKEYLKIFNNKLAGNLKNAIEQRFSRGGRGGPLTERQNAFLEVVNNLQSRIKVTNYNYPEGVLGNSSPRTFRVGNDNKYALKNTNKWSRFACLDDKNREAFLSMPQPIQAHFLNKSPSLETVKGFSYILNNQWNTYLEALQNTEVNQLDSENRKKYDELPKESKQQYLKILNKTGFLINADKTLAGTEVRGFNESVNQAWQKYFSK